jgi:PHD/YefM family antitoxin component YafN of YafNO toxin-antitoxin module
MTEVAIETERRPISEWLPRQNSQELIYLTKKGRKKFVVVPLDEMDEEVLAMRKNAALMAHIDKLFERARKGPTKSLEEIKAKFGIKDKAKGGGKRRIRKD